MLSTRTRMPWRSSSSSAAARVTLRIPPDDTSVASVPSRSRRAFPSTKRLSLALGASGRGTIESQVGRPGESGERGNRTLRLPVVAWGDDGHARQRPEDREILRGVVRDAERTVAEATTDRDDVDVGVVVGGVVADLLERPQGGEVGDRIGEHDPPVEREPVARPVMFCSATPALRNCAGSASRKSSSTPNPRSPVMRKTPGIACGQCVRRAMKVSLTRRAPRGRERGIELVAACRPIVPQHRVLHEGDALALDRVGDARTWAVPARAGRRRALASSARDRVRRPRTPSHPNARHLSANGSRASVSPRLQALDLVVVDDGDEVVEPDGAPRRGSPPSSIPRRTRRR